MNEHDPEKTNIDHSNGFTMVNTRELEPGIDPYVLLIQCEQVFYSEVPGKAEEEENVEEEGDTYQEQLTSPYVSYEESDQEVDHPNDVADDFVLGDDIDDEYITENGINDDVDMSYPFNDIRYFETYNDTTVDSNE